LLDNPYLKD
jgi:hypothetical protein